MSCTNIFNKIKFFLKSRDRNRWAISELVNTKNKLKLTTCKLVCMTGTLTEWKGKIMLCQINDRWSSSCIIHNVLTAQFHRIEYDNHQVEAVVILKLYRFPYWKYYPTVMITVMFRYDPWKFWHQHLNWEFSHGKWLQTRSWSWPKIWRSPRVIGHQLLLIYIESATKWYSSRLYAIWVCVDLHHHELNDMT